MATSDHKELELGLNVDISLSVKLNLAINVLFPHNEIGRLAWYLEHFLVRLDRAFIGVHPLERVHKGNHLWIPSCRKSHQVSVEISTMS